MITSIWTFVIIGIGACLGSWLRFILGYSLNGYFPPIPPGTLCTNLLGGFLVGGVVALTRHHVISPRLLLGFTTGFLGSLSTFSTFAAEVLYHLQQHDYMWMSLLILVHVVGTIVAAVFGFLLLKSVMV